VSPHNQTGEKVKTSILEHWKKRLFSMFDSFLSGKKLARMSILGYIKA
jgi:hypothetical protein